MNDDGYTISKEELQKYLALEARIAELERENAQIVELSDLIKAKADEYKARIAELERMQRG